MDKTKMSIDEQVEYLMQGTEYGDEALKQAMKNELRQRLIEAKPGEAPTQGVLRIRPNQTRPAPGAYHHHAQAGPIPRAGS